MRLNRKSSDLRINQRGFSLIELLVALFFTAILMAGLANIFKSSMSSFSTSSDKLSNSRRNRLAMDMVFDDVNAAGMYLTNLASYPSIFDPSYPPFYILPNQTYTGTDIPSAKATSDALFLYMDHALPYEGLVAANTGEGFAAYIPQGDGPTGQPEVYLPATQSIEVSFKAREAASQVRAGDYLIFRNGFEVKKLGALTPTELTNSSSLKANLSSDPMDNYGGATGAGIDLFRFAQKKDQPLVVVRPRQYIRYSIQGRRVETGKTDQTPCLVRDQFNYTEYTQNPATAVPTASMIVAENAVNLKVYVSVDGGATWIGHGSGSTTYTDVFKSALDTQLGAVGLQRISNTENPSWFREYPALVRLDLTTRSGQQRQEYSKDAKTRAYQEQTQSIVLVPRHFGLPF